VWKPAREKIELSGREDGFHALRHNIASRLLAGARTSGP
jgi:hypothetical protein